METGAGLGEAISLPQKTLKRLLRWCRSPWQVGHPLYLNGMLLVLEGKQLRVVATDGHRLSYAETTLETSASREIIIRVKPWSSCRNCWPASAIR